MNTLAEILTALMKKQRLSSSELARQTKVAQPIIYRLMRGNTTNPQVLTLKPLADFFNITVDQLMGFSPLNQKPALNRMVLHDISNRLTTIKTTASALNDIFPILEASYLAATSAKLIKNNLSGQLLPLLQLNIAHLIQLADEIRKSLTSDS